MSREGLVIAVDIDGTITDSPLHCGGLGVVGRTLWGVMKKTHLAEWAMRRARPIPEAVAWLNDVAEQGHVIRYVTAREDTGRYRRITVEWLQAHPLYFGTMVRMRPPGIDTVAHKIGSVIGAALYLEDQLEIAERMHKHLQSYRDTRGATVPLVVHMTSWKLQVPLLNMYLEKLQRGDEECVP